MATARNIIVNLLTYFSNNKNWNHTIRLYRNVPISHIRVSNPKRTYIRDYAFYINYFQSLTVEKVTSILNILEKSLNNYGIFNADEEVILLKSPEIVILSNEDIDILKNITQLLRTLVFADEIDDNEKFKDPITASLNDNNELSIHPGRTRAGIMEYLFLKNKKEYYVDVIFYKSNISDISSNHDGFLIDKEYTKINTFIDFIKAYGYTSIIDFVLGIDKENIVVILDPMNHYYFNKRTIIPKERFINKFPEILKMISNI
jgi:hypothetical protein